MNRGLENGNILGSSKGLYSGLHLGLNGFSTPNKLNMLNPTSITEPKIKPVFYINADNVALNAGSVQTCFNQIKSTPNELFPTITNIFDQTAGTTYRPPLVVSGLGDKNYIDFSDTSNRYLSSATTPASVYMYGSITPAVSATGFTYMFVVKRKKGGTYTILDGRDSSTTASTNDILLEVDASGKIVFSYCGGNSGSVTTLNGTAGINLLNDWSILTIKCQLRIDGGFIGSDSSAVGSSPITKRYEIPMNARNGNISSAIDIFVNGIEQQKTITSGTFTNADWYNDGSFRMLDRDIWIGNKGTVFATSGTQMGACLMIPTYISNGLQTKIENYFRWYYNKRF